MAESLVVQSLLDNLDQLLTYNAGLFLKKDKGPIEGLMKDLRPMKDFVEASAKIPNPPYAVREMVRTIRDTTYMAEDAIDTYVVEEAILKSGSLVKKMLHTIDHPTKIRSVADEVRDVRTTVQAIYDGKGYGFGPQVDAGSGSPKMFTRSFVEEEKVVGFDNEANKLIHRLIEGTPDLQVISIVGMAGMGKTTLAQKIYADSQVKQVFDMRVWSCVSQSYKRMDVLLDILRGFIPDHQVISNHDDMMMIDKQVYRHLSDKKYLIVLDDIWATEDWKNLPGAFPDNKNGSRILLTTRNMEVALYSPSHRMKFLTKDESWELLQKKVFGPEKCPSELEAIGKQIVEKCKGLPLAIILVAGILRGNERRTWELVASDFNRYVVTRPDLLNRVFALSYNKLPYNLKACFLYFGVFPKNFEIPVWKLIRLWIAEGFVPKSDSMEDRAEEILEELAGRNMVMVSQRSLLGGIKTCRVHDMLRDLCLTKAEQENYYYELKTAYGYGPTVSNFYRRLCIHSRILDFISSKPSGELVRSFLCFNSSEENKQLPREYTSYLPRGFPLLRVFDIQPISFSIFPTNLTQLLLLRYLAISGKFRALPSAVSDLSNLQTLIVETTERIVDIHADISKMKYLRHVHTSGASKLSGPPSTTARIPLFGKKSEGPSVSNNLQTFSSISAESCTENVVLQFPNIKKLGIRGKLSILMEGKKGSISFDLAKFVKLKKLKLVNDVSSLHPPSDGKLSGLPMSFPPHLKKLTLQDTKLDWKHMSVLEMLPELVVLKLKDFAFSGKEWNISGESKGFAELGVLHIGKTDLECWDASKLHFPKIQRLVIKECKSLKALPLGLGDLSTLRMIELHHASPSAVASARNIQQQQQRNSGNKGLQVDIYPLEHNNSAP